MMARLAMALVAMALLVTQPASARQGDLITEMTVPLAVDPAGAAARADREIARLRARGPGGPLAAAYWVRAQARFRIGDEAGARAALADLRAAATTPDARRALAYADLLTGLLAKSDGNFAAAFSSLRRAQRAFIDTGDDRGQALALQSVGTLYVGVGNGTDALRYFRLAEQIYSGDDVFLLSLHNNLGVAYQASDNLADSNRSLRRALALADKLDLPSFVTRIRLNLALNHVMADEMSQADTLLDMVSRQTLSSVDRREVERLRARIALARGDIGAAIAHVRRALNGADPATSDASYWTAHQAAYLIYQAAGMRDEALTQLEAVRRLDEADAQLTASNRAALLSAQFQFDAQQTQIAQLKAETLEQEVYFQRRVAVVAVTGGLIVLLLLAGLLHTAIRARRRAEADGAELLLVNRRLEQALAAKTEFLASTSHELRTPLNGILGMTQILLADTEVSARHRTQIELLHDAGATMRGLVDDILDVAKIEHGGFTITPRPADVDALVRRVVRLFDAQASNAGLTLRVTSDVAAPVGLVDPDRLTQILFNLVGNAIKFTPVGEVEVMLRQQDGTGDDPGTLVLAVRDSGIGIAPEWHEGVFDMFRQVDGARSRAYGGTGLGLAICRQLARAMGGDIVLDSAAGQGSTFTVTLPWVPATADDAADPADPGGASAAIAANGLVIVSFDPMRGAMLAAMARHAGYAGTMVDTQAGVAALAPGSGLTLLVDGPAWSAIDPPPAGPGRVIIVGGHDHTGGRGRGDMLGAGGSKTLHVPFTRNAVVQALIRGAPHPPDGRLGLHGGPNRRNAMDEAGEEPNRPQLMSQY